MANWAAAAAWSGYRLFGLVARPAIPLVLARRVKKGKEDPERLNERYGIASQERPKGRVVWVHAASVGETNAALPLVRRIVAAGLSVVLTTVTVTAAKVAAERLPAQAIHQYSPLDSAAWVGRFLAHWRPDLAILVESEIWPQTIMSLSAAGIPRVIVNAKLSERSSKGWQRVGAVAHLLFSNLTLCLAQSEADGARYRALGVPSVAVTGNLKFDSPAPHADPAALAELKTMVGARPVWVAASTHPGEEEIVVAAHREAAKRHPGLLTMIAPRHPERGPAIQSLVAAQRLRVAARSRCEPVTPDTEVYLADTLGELGVLYRVAPVAYVGGSLVPHGGQNPIEPIRLHAAVLHGPHVHNFEEVYAAVDRAVPETLVADTAGLAAAVASLLGDPARREAAARAELAALSPYAGALDRTFDALQPFLQGGRDAARAL